MIKASIELQGLRRKIYLKVKAEPAGRFWGLLTHVLKLETLRKAYKMAKRNGCASGFDGVTFKAVEEVGVVRFLMELRKELISGQYRPLPNR